MRKEENNINSIENISKVLFYITFVISIYMLIRYWYLNSLIIPYIVTVIIGIPITIINIIHFMYSKGKGESNG